MDSALCMDIPVINKNWDTEELQTFLNVAFIVIYKQNHSFTLSYAIRQELVSKYTLVILVLLILVQTQWYMYR